MRRPAWAEAAGSGATSARRFHTRHWNPSRAVPGDLAAALVAALLVHGWRLVAGRLVDATGNVIKDQEATAIKVFIDDVEVPGSFELKTFREANQALGVALLMTASVGYARPLDGLGVILERAKVGFVDFPKRLTDQDRVAAWSLDEMGVKALHAWSNTPAQAAQNVGQLLKPNTDSRSSPRPISAARRRRTCASS